MSYSDPFGLCPIPKPGEDCIQEGINWAYTKTHSEGLLNALAGAGAAFEAIGQTFFDEPGSANPAGAASAAGSVLFRFGTKAETVEGLAVQAAKAEAGGFGHGVSVTTRKPTIQAAKSALRSAVEEVFSVRRTGNTPGHHTVDLPKPVTQQVTDLFNQLFKP